MALQRLYKFPYVYNPNSLGVDQLLVAMRGPQGLLWFPCKHPSFNGCSMDVPVLCSLDVLIYVLMSSFFNVRP